MPGGMHFVSGLTTEHEVTAAINDLVAQVEAQQLERNLEPQFD